MALISLTRAAMSACDVIGDTSYKYLAKMMRHANRGVKDLMTNVVPYVSETNITSIILPIGVNFYAQLPEDFIYETKVGICVDGRIVLLGVNDDMCLGNPLNQNCDCNEENTAAINALCCGQCEGNYQYPFYNAWRSGQPIGELYGLSGGTCYVGYYKIDKMQNRILLSSDLTAQEVIVEYKADYTLNGIASIPTEIELAVQMFCLWQHNMQASPTIADRNRSEYIIEYEKLKKVYGAMTADELRSVFLRATTSTVRR